MTTLAQTLAIMAGGAGSGCRGPNCGRPVLVGKELQEEFRKYKTVEEQYESKLRDAAADLLRGKSTPLARQLKEYSKQVQAFLGPGKTTLFRGISGDQATSIAKQLEAGKKDVLVRLEPGSSFTTSSGIAKRFATEFSEGGVSVVLKLDMDHRNILTDYRFGSHGAYTQEKEVVASQPGRSVRIPASYIKVLGRAKWDTAEKPSAPMVTYKGPTMGDMEKWFKRTTGKSGDDMYKLSRSKMDKLGEQFDEYWRNKS